MNSIPVQIIFMIFTSCIGTLNINGLKNKCTQQILRQRIFNEDIDFLFLQEVNTEDFSFLGNRYDAVVNIGESERGTAIVYRTGLAIKFCEKHSSGRITSIMTENNVLMINLYLPSGTNKRQERELFITNELPFYLRHNYDAILIGGDFNCVLNARDQKGVFNFSPALHSVCKEFNFCDVWEAKHDMTPGYTFYRGDSASRLDRIYVKNTDRKKISNVNIHPVPCSDHHILILKMELNNSANIPFGRSYWKLNESIFNEKCVENDFRQLWDNKMKQASNSKLSLLKQWQKIYKPAIKSFFQKYSYEIGRERQQKIEFYYKVLNDLLKKQQQGENISSHMNSVKKCICRIQNNILEGNKIRSRVESIVEEERTSMYHIAKEKQNENKKIHKKVMRPKWKVFEHYSIPEIRNEVERYYKDLYSKQVTSVSAQSQILKSVNTHLSLEDTAEIEADITENEVELAIRTARIKSSPGPDGIGYGFYRKFWPVIKEVLVKVLNSVLNEQEEKSGFSDGIIILIPKEDVGSYRNVEISSAFSHLPQKDMARDSPVGSPVVSRRNDLNSLNNSYHIDPGLHEQAFQQQILQLKKQQQLQQQILLQHFQAQQQQLAEQHEQQLRQHLKAEKATLRFQQRQAMFWEQQKQLEEQRERREKEKLEALKKKEKHEQSAVASTEVKQKLQGFLLNKKQREAAAAANGALPVSSQSGFRSWSVLQAPQGSEASSSTTSINTASGVVHPYRLQPMMAKFDDDFPLRKTASEPNLLKVRLKARVIERRNSPMARRKDRLLNTLKRKSQLAIDTSNSNPDSGPNSPPNVTNAQASPTAGRNTPIQEEGEVSPYGPLASSSQQGSMSDLSLYSSPSMPNISLGRPPVHSSSEGSKLAPVSEAEVRAAFTARLGMPLTGQMLPGTLPFYPTLPVIDGEYSNPSSPGYIHKQMQSLEQARPGNMLPSVYQGAPITDTQVAHARLNKQGHRPLGRTQSAPLPLGHPMLAGSSITIVPSTYYEEYLPDKQMYDQQQQAHNFLKQQIRQTVLTRAGSRGQTSGGQLDEAPETDETAEVIDLTDRKGSEESEISKQQRDREQFLQQQRDLMMRHTLQVSEGSAFSPRSSHIARPLSRALSSPLVALGPSDIPPSSCVSVSNHCGSKVGGAGPHRLTTGLAFDSLMLKHACICGDNSSHPEHGGRLQSVWARLMETGLVQRCDRVRSRKATLEEIQACHSEAHALLFGTNPLNRQKLDMSKLSQLPIKSFVRLPCGGIGVDSDTTWNELHTAPAARMAVGCVVDLAFKAATGDIKNGFAVVRPPGHHAEASQAMGFCFFNSVAIAARLLQQRLDIQRILIVDWDVHHGNGTQQMFYDDPRVLYLSIHRHDDGNFFPGTGGPTECGIGEGVGYNVNVAWSGGLAPPMGDAEYLAAFRTIVLPIAKEFAPDIVLVSAGFDAAAGHAAPLGGYKVSPACFGHMTQQLLKFADGKVILSLEGGYDLPSICDSAQECVRALLGDDPSPLREEELRRLPCQNAIDTLQKTIAIQLPHWPCIKRTAHTAVCSAVEAMEKEKDETETVTAMASLSMQHQNNSLQTPEHSRDPSEEPMEQDDAK